uniref:Uncharacterized protein n=1 Tax=Escherichia coli TaxID=562 RepID=A0A5B9T4B6_ECOLX|nr:hypothetical protein [Escherichia coli]
MLSGESIRSNVLNVYLDRHRRCDVKTAMPNNCIYYLGKSKVTVMGTECDLTRIYALPPPVAFIV